MKQITKLSVVTDHSGNPVSLMLNSKKLRVIKILKFWRTNRNWWQTGKFAEQKFWQVAAESAQTSIVIEISFDEELDQWRLVRKLVG
jgi:hypothetical protein